MEKWEKYYRSRHLCNGIIRKAKNQVTGLMVQEEERGKKPVKITEDSKTPEKG